VIDPQAGVLYAAAKTKESNGSYHYRLHALNVSTGVEMFGGPAEISAANFVPLQQMNRPGLLLSGGNVYVAFGSVGDTPPWYGWVMAYDASTLAQVAVLNTSPSVAQGGSIWSGGQGPVADSSGNVYVITANGDFNANVGGSDYGTSFLKLDGSNLSVLDYFTPDNQSYLGNFVNDVDLGAGGPLLIPGSTLLLGGGKDGFLRVVNSANMGKFNSDFNNDVQEWPAIAGLIMGAPVYWDSPTLGPVVYMWGAAEPLRAWSFNGQTFQTTPATQSTMLNSTGYSNMAPLSISSNGNTAGTGIVWAATSRSGDANAGTVPGQLWAFDASDLTNELWDSQQNSSRDSVTTFGKYVPPTVANGKVYVATFSDQVLVYGLTAAAVPSFALTATAMTPATIAPGGSATSTVTVSPSGGFNSTVSLTCTVMPVTAVPPRCSLSSSAVPGGSGTPTLTVTTVAATTSARPIRGSSLYFAMLLPLCGMTLLGAKFKSRSRNLLGWLLVCLMVSGLVWLSACGGTSSSAGIGGGTAGTTAGSYTVTVTGTAGTLVQTQVLAVTVQ
jgi:hypothetical protein